MPFTLVGTNRIVTTATPFTGTVTVHAAIPGYKILVKGWSLTISGAVAGMQLRFGSSGTKYLGAMPADAALTGRPWAVDGVRYMGDDNETLQLLGGAVGAVVDGHVDIELLAD